jgi:catechol 2,3-dioxygenase-like lactoylglutathione lyase family enzyme
LADDDLKVEALIAGRSPCIAFLDSDMSVQLNHTIVWCRNQQTSATFLTGLLGLPVPVPFGPFLVVELGNGVSLDYHETEGAITSQHYAFLVGEEDFDQTFGRFCARGLAHWADPGLRRAGEINRNDGGRGVYFEDPDGHLLEIITRPYGSGG